MPPRSRSSWLVTTRRSSPFPDDRFDAALCTWVLCGIPDAAAALAEVARVLTPGAARHFVEHGLAPDRTPSDGSGAATGSTRWSPAAYSTTTSSRCWAPRR